MAYVFRQGSRTRLAALGVVLAALATAVAFAPAAEAKSKAKGAAPWFPFAPYVDMAGYPPPDLTAIRSGSGAVNRITLGFVTAQGGSSCTPTWGGYAEYPAAGKGAYRLANIQAFRSAGGQVALSFGGQAGAELATVCRSVKALTAAYRRAISAYHATYVDFDIEGAAITNAAANTRRARAIAALQRSKTGKKGKKSKKGKSSLAVAFTLPVLPDGLDSDGLAIVAQAVKKKVAVSIVNGMAMDYGDAAAPLPDGRMGAIAIQVANAMFSQLSGVFRGQSAPVVWRHVGITPMIGINDVPTEKFYVSDAQQLVAFARSQHIGMLGMWQLARDSQCALPTLATREDCSGVYQAPWQFSQTLAGFTG